MHECSVNCIYKTIIVMKLIKGVGYKGWWKLCTNNMKSSGVKYLYMKWLKLIIKTESLMHALPFPSLSSFTSLSLSLCVGVRSRAPLWILCCFHLVSISSPPCASLIEITNFPHIFSTISTFLSFFFPLNSTLIWQILKTTR